jgi:hypothetical protein
MVRQKTALIYVDCDCNFDGIKMALENGFKNTKFKEVLYGDNSLSQPTHSAS